jgi:hypothetical protein
MPPANIEVHHLAFHVRQRTQRSYTLQLKDPGINTACRVIGVSSAKKDDPELHAKTHTDSTETAVGCIDLARSERRSQESTMKQLFSTTS